MTIESDIFSAYDNNDILETIVNDLKKFENGVEMTDKSVLCEFLVGVIGNPASK